MSHVSKPPRHPLALVPVLALAAALPAPVEAAPVLAAEDPLVLPVPEDDDGHTAPAVALRPDGGFVAVWIDLDAGVVGRWFGPPDAEGASESGFFSIGGDAGLPTGHSPVLARGADGDYLAVWSQTFDGAAALVARPFGGQGELLAPAQSVAAGPSPSFALAPRPGGGFILAWWYDGPEASEIRFRFLGAQGFPLGEVIVAELAPGVNARPVRVATDSEGSFVVSWSRYLSAEETASVRARPYSSHGEPLGPAFDVVLPEPESGWIEHDLGASAPGTFVLVWTRFPRSTEAVQELYTRAFLTGGALGQTHRLDDNDDPIRALGRPSVATGPDGDGVVAWADGSFANLRLLARLIHLDGAPRSASFEVGPSPIPADYIRGIDTDRDADGRLLFAWGLGLDSPFIPPDNFIHWSNAAQRFRETDPDCLPVLSLDFRTEPAAPEAGDPVRLLFEGLADCAEVSLVDWSFDGGAFQVEAEADSGGCGTAFPPVPISVPVEVGALDAGDYPVTIDVALEGGGTCSREFDFTVEPEPAEPPPPPPPPPPPETPPLTSPSVPGFRVWVEITAPGGGAVSGVKEAACIPETLCVSGRVPGRSEVFVRVVGPKPNGRLWPTLVKFSTSTVEVWLEQVSTGEVEYYRLEASPRGVDELPGLFDREGFEP